MTLFGVEKLKQAKYSLIQSMASVVWGNSWFRWSEWSWVQIRCQSLFHEVLHSQMYWLTQNPLLKVLEYNCYVVKQYLFSIFTIISKLISD